MIRRWAALVVAVAVAVVMLGVAAAQGCLRGALAPGYCDIDGDLLADVPTDPGEWNLPDVLVFAPGPLGAAGGAATAPAPDPAAARDVWTAFVVHLERVTGKRVHLSGLATVEAQLEAMRAGRLHVAGFDAHCVPWAVDTAGFRPFAALALPGTAYGVAHDLDQDLVARVQEAFFGFAWAGSELEAAVGPSGATPVVPVSYHDDWAVVRRLEATCRLGGA